ncbi:hypothetical protein HanIR_Chr14g0716021 [Helianthus annuus]|nr:hypothetical protein HanIR_Chr14g0716021 [Helianthus annuus]
MLKVAEMMSWFFVLQVLFVLQIYSGDDVSGMMKMVEGGHVFEDLGLKMMCS